VIFIVVNIERSSFEGLDDIIKVYKGNHLIVPKYAGHIHREHMPHHKFMQCRISGWKWNLKELNSENIPIQVYP
ncbi:MAG: hypothetical protein ACFFAO_08845, partial [Candidatus Hermodarchaeota archaeon]